MCGPVCGLASLAAVPHVAAARAAQLLRRVLVATVRARPGRPARRRRRDRSRDFGAATSAGVSMTIGASVPAGVSAVTPASAAAGASAAATSAGASAVTPASAAAGASAAVGASAVPAGASAAAGSSAAATSSGWRHKKVRASLLQCAGVPSTSRGTNAARMYRNRLSMETPSSKLSSCIVFASRVSPRGRCSAFDKFS